MQVAFFAFAGCSAQMDDSSMLQHKIQIDDCDANTGKTNTPGGIQCCPSGCTKCKWNNVGGQTPGFECEDTTDCVPPPLTGTVTVIGGVQACCNTGCLTCEWNTAPGQPQSFPCLDPKVGDYCDGLGATCGGYQGYECSNIDVMIPVDDYRYYSESQCATFFPMGSAAGTPRKCGTLAGSVNKVTTSRGTCIVPPVLDIVTVGQYQQCGGTNWAGATQCADDLTCTMGGSEWYYSCL